MAQINRHQIIALAARASAMSLPAEAGAIVDEMRAHMLAMLNRCAALRENNDALKQQVLEIEASTRRNMNYRISTFIEALDALREVAQP